MAKYKITDTSLNNIANAIKNKTGTTESLNYPSGFINELNSINAVNYDVYGFIHVIYPEGSECVAESSDGVELSAPDTSGDWTILVPEPTTSETTWTINCNNGIQEDSIEVIISNQIRTQEVELFCVDNILNNNSWEEISRVAQAGKGDEYWDIGDCKEIVLNGQIGDYLTLTNETLYMFILDFNHPIDKSTPDNNIIFGGFKTSADTNGVDVALCDSRYGGAYSSGEKVFNINHYGSSSSPYNANYGGWKGCDFRYDILGGTSTAPSPYNTTKTTSTTGSDATQATIDTPVADTLMAALPSDLRTVLRLWNRYIDYIGNSSNIDANCSTATVDAISLLAEFEIFGSRSYANRYEQDHQEQMAYYINGNSKIKYRHNYQNDAAQWWESSAYRSNAEYFCQINTSGNMNFAFSRNSYGLAPAFKI